MKQLRLRNYKIILILGGMVFLFVGGFLFLRAKVSMVKQPILFNHKKHTQDVGLECSDCHLYYKKYAFSGKPTVETCLSCHEEAITQSPEEEKIRQYAKQGEEIEWKRLYWLPDDVHYSHQRHVVVGEIECQICHGNIGQSIEPPRRAEVKLTMGMCIECHKKKEVTTDCIACHK
ncbi:MAG: cytochrome c3 family protein [Candidatus Aminicenantia bacterium]